MSIFPPRHVAAALLACAFIAGCDSQTAETPSPTEMQGTPLTSAPEQISAATVAGMNDFAARLYEQLDERAEGDANIFFSPVSIEAAFGIVLAGAKGETASQMTRALRLSSAAPDLHTSLGGVMRAMQRPGANDEPTLSIANALWTQERYPLRPEFLATAQEDYEAIVEALDMRGDAPAAVKQINDWVAEKTRDRINSIISPGMLDQSTAMVVTNAIYFLGDWKHEFSPDQTRDEPFYRPGGTQTVPLMYRTMEVRHISGDGFQAVDLPYKGDDLSMSIILPDARDGLNDIEARMADGALAKTLTALGTTDPREVFVYLPKLQIEMDLDLIPPLQSLGMQLPFGSSADLSGIAEADLYISAARHMAFLQIDETGTEAAAATAVIVPQTAPINPPPTFRADHPYMFVIRERASGTILFIGRISDPAAKS